MKAVLAMTHHTIYKLQIILVSWQNVPPFPCESGHRRPKETRLCHILPLLDALRIAVVFIRIRNSNASSRSCLNLLRILPSWLRCVPEWTHTAPTQFMWRLTDRLTCNNRTPTTFPQPSHRHFNNTQWAHPFPLDATVSERRLLLPPS